MPLSDRTRLTQNRLQPQIVQLWFALSGLRSVVGFMQSGAHPDDETSEMLAALRFRDGLGLSYVCSTRGEGGQNDLGTESGSELGVLRTAEMERACEILDMRMWWLSDAPDDSITDFGFSKSGDETLAKWGRDRLLAQFVRVVRMDKPDILCPTFLDVPGQHGHHRAMTQAASLVMQAAADPGFKGCNLPVWQVSKLYLPAWGGGGTAYDDQLPPPPASVIVSGTGCDPITGWTWGQIGQHSRMFHATQGMGKWSGPDHEHDWPLHLAISHVGADRDAVTDNLPVGLADLGLEQAADAVARTGQSFPDTAAIFAHAAKALNLIRTAEAQVAPEHRHRLQRKQAELARVMRIASGAQVRGWLERDHLRPGELSKITIEHRPATHGKSHVALALPDGWREQDNHIGPAPDCPHATACQPRYDPLSPSLPAINVTLSSGNISATSVVGLEISPQVAPDRSARLTPARILVNLASYPGIPPVTCDALYPADATPRLTLPEGWQQNWHDAVCKLVPPSNLSPGLFQSVLMLDGQPAQTATEIAYPHIEPRLHIAPAILHLRVIEAEIPDARLGYIGGGNDQVAKWLSAMGANTVILDDHLSDHRLLDDIDSLVIGVFAFRSRPGLVALTPRIRQWVENGGNLVTLYHRPWDSWDPVGTPPRRIEIGQPSLRWRVTDENAKITHLQPDHPILTGPNRIGPDDWDGWVKERGLYFAKSWDPAYIPLLEMADPGEAPHNGALLSGDIGKGRHSHVALGLHVQMQNLIPGAFRLMANLINPRNK